LSIRLKTCSLLALAASGALLAATPASAETVYGGGGTLAAGLFRNWLDCRGTILVPVTTPANPSTGLPPATPASCATGTTPDRQANIFGYAGVGSGAGITAFLGQTSPTAVPTAPKFPNGNQDWESSTQGINYPAGVGYPRFDFAGSDATLTDAQINTYNTSAAPTRDAAVQLPIVATPVTIPFKATGLNIARPIAAGGNSGLYLSRKAYCGIFTGNIHDWADPILTADNLGTALVSTSTPIKVIVRSDSSGTTFLLSRHLEAVCDGSANAGGYNWNGGVGTTVTWPTVAGSSFTAFAGSGGVASTVQATAFSIGYVSPDYTQMVASPGVTPAPVVANLQNQADIAKTPATVTPRAPTLAATSAGVSAFVVPSINDARRWSAAIEGGTVTGSTQIIPTGSTNKMRNPPATATTAYPITGFTMANFYGCYTTATQTTAIKNFISWYTGSATNPDFIAGRDGFSPLLSSLKSTISTYAASAISTCS
jgi:phosphate transport system substrate-binding protein